jgi:hypothetical protein
MSSPKDRVRGNIYKELFSAEKRKNKKLVLTSLGLFVFGIIGGSTFQSMKQMDHPTVMMALSSNWERMKNSNNIDLQKLKIPQIKLDGVSFINASEIGTNITLDHILNGDIFETTNSIREINTDNLYDLDV